MPSLGNRDLAGQRLSHLCRRRMENLSAWCKQPARTSCCRLDRQPDDRTTLVARPVMLDVLNSKCSSQQALTWQTLHVSGICATGLCCPPPPPPQGAGLLCLHCVKRSLHLPRRAILLCLDRLASSGVNCRAVEKGSWTCGDPSQSKRASCLGHGR